MAPGEDRKPEEEPLPPQHRARARRQEALTERLGAAEERMVRARQRERKSAWFGLGAFGLVGWSVAVPTLAGLALGVWLDARYPLGFSWTLTLLVTGIVLGCLNAWYWLSRERQEIERERGDDDLE